MRYRRGREGAKVRWVAATLPLGRRAGGVTQAAGGTRLTITEQGVPGFEATDGLPLVAP